MPDYTRENSRSRERRKQQKRTRKNRKIDAKGIRKIKQGCVEASLDELFGPEMKLKPWAPYY